jgi:hypothetical protein
MDADALLRDDREVVDVAPIGAGEAVAAVVEADHDEIERLARGRGKIHLDVDPLADRLDARSRDGCSDRAGRSNPPSRIVDPS